MDKHVVLMSQIEAQYMAKNLAYSNAAHVTYCRFGPAAYALRLTDKMSRYENLRLHPDIDKGDEAIDDTLRDAINYVCMLVGDLRVDSTDVGNTENIKETLKVIHKLASLSQENISEYASVFINSHIWKKANALLEDVPYVMYEEEASINYYIYFAAYLITLYLDRGANIEDD